MSNNTQRSSVTLARIGTFGNGSRQENIVLVVQTTLEEYVECERAKLARALAYIANCKTPSQSI